MLVLDEQRRIYGSETGEEPPRYIGSPQRQASPFPLESTNRRYYRRNRNSKGTKTLINSKIIEIFVICYTCFDIARVKNLQLIVHGEATDAYKHF